MALDKIHCSFIFIFFIAIGFKVCSASDWSYDGKEGDGPSNWNKAHPDCAKKSQSPIDIQPSESQYKVMTAMNFEGYNSAPKGNKFTLLNNGHTVQLTVDEGEMIISNADLPGKYKLAQFHMHWGSSNGIGSEHTVYGRQFPMEIHFVHSNVLYGSTADSLTHNDGLAVIGAFVEITKESHSTMGQLIEQLCAIRYKGSSVGSVPIFRMDSMLPDNQNDFYRYNGSLTTPGCAEVVTWTVLRDTVKISQTQMNAFRALSHNAKAAESDVPLVNNFRPLQPLGSRSVARNFQSLPKSDGGRATASAVTLSLAITVVIGTLCL